MKYRVVIDSCGELLERWKNQGVFFSAPLTLQVEEEQIVDDETFDQEAFLKKVAASPHCPKSACPSPEYYQNLFNCEAEHVFAVTLSSQLSGSYNSAQLGKSLVLEDHPDKKIHVFDSKSASIGETLIGLKIEQLEEEGLDFDTIVRKTENYIRQQHTGFVLENLDTLRKNGRLSNLKAMLASALKIKPVLGSTKEGEICQIDKARGMNKALVKMVDYLVEATDHPQQKVAAVSHCNSPLRAQLVCEAIKEKMPVKDCIILDTAGVSTMYANDGGIIVVV